MDFSVQLQIEHLQDTNKFNTNNINPGLGQFVELYSHYVPLHAHGNYEIEKKLNIEETSVNHELEGLGETNIEEKPSLKRKMDDSIRASFLHPVIRVGSIKLPKTEKIEKKIKTNQTGGKQTESTKSTTSKVNHKFQFI